MATSTRCGIDDQRGRGATLGRRLRPAPRQRGEESLQRVFAAGEALAPDDGSLRRAREHATAVAAMTAPRHGTFVASVAFAADIVSRAAVEPEWPGEGVRRLVRAVAQAAGVDARSARAAICVRALRDPRLHELPPRLAAETVLRLLHALAPVRGVSLWLAPAGRRARRAIAYGARPTTTSSRALAQQALADAAAVEADDAVALPVLRWQRPAAAVVLATDGARRSAARALGEEAAAALAVVLEREALLERGMERERSLVEASERRLVRVAFDIHDCAIQDVLALAADVRLLRSQLDEIVPDARGRAIATGRVDDLHARLGAIEGDLRDVTKTLAPPAIAQRPLDETLGEQLAALGERYGIETRLDAAGELSALTPSQRIALLRIVQEAANNAHEHGRATRIDVWVRAKRDGLHARVEDDGCGFDVERTLTKAARNSRLGLVGISERVRLLGGRFDIDSCPGGPTVLSVSFPPWSPLESSGSANAEPASLAVGLPAEAMRPLRTV